MFYFNTSLFRKPIPAVTSVVVQAKIEKIEGRKVFLSATVESLHGVKYADATALFVVPRDKESLLQRYGSIDPNITPKNAILNK